MKIVPDNCKLFLTALLTAAIFLPGPVPAAPPQTPLTAKRMNTLDAENARMAQRVGSWDVTETVWASPGAAPVVTHAVAERRMIGMFLQEIIRSVPGAPAQGIKRIDYLSFHPIEGRWKYVSMDTRAPVGIMTAQSFGRGPAARIEITFQPFAVPAAQEGAKVLGQLLQMRELIIQKDASHDRKDQYFITADGTGHSWLAHRYVYTRQP